MELNNTLTSTVYLVYENKVPESLRIVNRYQ